MAHKLWLSPPLTFSRAGVLYVLLLTVAQTSAQNTSGKLQSCQVAQLQCHARTGCMMALNNFFIHCSTLIAGDEERNIETCPTDCKHALVSLLSTEDNKGHAFINCDCGEDKTCIERKRKVSICQREVLDSMHVLRDDAPPVTCNLARWICEADTSCLVALQYYNSHCSRLFKGIRCSSKCKNSIQILSAQQHASKLRNCLCDGSEDYDCSAVKTNTEEMCFHRKKGGQKQKVKSSKDTRRGRARRRSRRRKRRNQAWKNWRKANRKRRRQRREERRKRQKMRKASSRAN